MNVFEFKIIIENNLIGFIPINTKIAYLPAIFDLIKTKNSYNFNISISDDYPLDDNINWIIINYLLNNKLAKIIRTKYKLNKTIYTFKLYLSIILQHL